MQGQQEVYLAQLILRNFRNHEDLEIHLSEGLNIFFGENASGKTNILESIYLLSTVRSHRGARDKDMVRWNAPGYAVTGMVRRSGTERRVDLVYDVSSRRKSARVDSVAEPQVGQLLGHINSVVFSPEDMDLVNGAPTARRRYFDRQISQMDAGYYRYLVAYHRALSQRNALLKAGPGAREDSLAVWDHQISEIGARIMQKRARVIEVLSSGTKGFSNVLSGGRENLNLMYSPSLPGVVWPQDTESIRDAITLVLQRRRREEINRRVTLVGPHRDDVLFNLDGVSAKAYASQGQRRTAVLSLKMAEVEFMESETGEAPILLLDDVASELDPKRRKFLVRAVEGRIQTIITTTNLTDIGPLTVNARLFRVSGGRVSHGEEV